MQKGEKFDNYRKINEIPEFEQYKVQETMTLANHPSFLKRLIWYNGVIDMIVGIYKESENTAAQIFSNGCGEIRVDGISVRYFDVVITLEGRIELRMSTMEFVLSARDSSYERLVWKSKEDNPRQLVMYRA